MFNLCLNVCLDVKFHEGSVLFCFIIVDPEGEIIILGAKKVMSVYLYFFK